MTSANSNLTPTSSSSGLLPTSSQDGLEANSDPIWFARLQEVLLMHRPFDFCVLLVVIELIFGFIYFLNLGIFATIALLGLISYMLFIHYCHPNPIFEKIFFPPLKKPIDQTQPNRIRSYEEFSNFVASFHHTFQHYFGHKHLTGIKRVIFGIGSFIFALLLKRVVPFWVNFLLVHCILFLPLAILRPWPTKDVPGEEQKSEDTTTQTSSQAQVTENNQSPSTASAATSTSPGVNNITQSNQNQIPLEDLSTKANTSKASSPSTFREVIMEPTNENPLADNFEDPLGITSTPSAKKTANLNNSNALPTPPMTPNSVSSPAPSSPAPGLPPVPPSTPSSGLPPIPPSSSTPKNTSNSAANPNVTTKAATSPKPKGLLKGKFSAKGKNNKDETD